eukprot:5034970-Amphidinium_carterae.1
MCNIKEEKPETASGWILRQVQLAFPAAAAAFTALIEVAQRQDSPFSNPMKKSEQSVRGDLNIVTLERMFAVRLADDSVVWKRGPGLFSSCLEKCQQKSWGASALFSNATQNEQS